MDLRIESARGIHAGDILVEEVDDAEDQQRPGLGAEQQWVSFSDPSRRARETRSVAKGPLSIVSQMPGRVVRLQKAARMLACVAGLLAALAWTGAWRNVDR